MFGEEAAKGSSESGYMEVSANGLEAETVDWTIYGLLNIFIGMSKSSY
jgi:hypothetical protein